MAATSNPAHETHPLPARHPWPLGRGHGPLLSGMVHASESAQPRGGASQPPGFRILPPRR